MHAHVLSACVCAHACMPPTRCHAPQSDVPYYPHLRDEKFMGQLDVEMSYRTCSQTPTTYFYYRNITGGWVGT